MKYQRPWRLRADFPMLAIPESKRAMREWARGARAGGDPVTAGKALTEIVLRACPPPAGAVVSGFWPMQGEIDIRPLLGALHAAGHDVVLPVTPKLGHPLTFRVWHPDEAMVREKFGTFAPSGAVLSPDFLLVPLLAFDRGCFRLGYGGGYFDRTLPLLPNAFTLGCAFAAQEVPRVPTEAFDVRLDAIATEGEIIRALT